MAHYAKVVDGVVTQVIVAEPGFFDDFTDVSPGDWVATSYNIRQGVYYDPSTGAPALDQDAAIAEDAARGRKNYAAVGWLYDGVGFYPPKPFASWSFDSQTYLWTPPVTAPDDGNMYSWNEETQTWDEVS